MSFSNPLQVSVPAEGQDFFYWPGISGERYPPTLTTGAGSMSYTSKDAFPCVGGASSTGPADPTAVWPAIPLWSPTASAFTGLTVTGRAWVALPASASPIMHLRTRCYSALTAAAGLQFFRSGAQVAAVVAGTSGAISAQILLTPSSWVSFTLTITAAGTISLTAAGSTVTAPVGGVPDKAPNLQLDLQPGGATSIEGYLTQLQVSYT